MFINIASVILNNFFQNSFTCTLHTIPFSLLAPPLNLPCRMEEQTTLKVKPSTITTIGRHTANTANNENNPNKKISFAVKKRKRESPVTLRKSVF